MNYIELSLRALGGVALGVIIFLALQSSHQTAGPASLEQTATTTAVVAVADPAPAATSTATTTPAAPAKPKGPLAKPIAQAPVAGGTSDSSVTVEGTPPKAQSLPSDQVNATTRASLVNIMCTMVSGGQEHFVSGSGVIVDSRGIIITNAHVGQMFLLRDYPTAGATTCTIRTGSPAQPRYTAKLLYLPPAWIAANASQITAEQAVGTGEHDYAFLLITGTTNGSALPSTFSHLAMRSAAPDSGELMLLAAYPAGFLSAEIINANLYASSAVTTVSTLYSFDGSQIVDLFSVGGTIVSQGGSSGGAAVRLSDGTLAGLIVTASVADVTAARDLRAVGLGHVDRSLTSLGMGGIAGLLSRNAVAQSAEFNTAVAPGLTQKLLDAINHR